MPHCDSTDGRASALLRVRSARTWFRAAACLLLVGSAFFAQSLGAASAAPYLHLSAYAGKQVSSAPFPTNKVALTFDDGVSANTLTVARTLNRYNAHATFFFIGRAANENTAIQRLVVRQGSEIGNHTWEHVSLSGLSLNSDLDQISLTDSVVLGATGRWPRWVRSRAGIVDGTGMAAIGRLNHLCCRWSVEGNDTVPDFTSAQIADSVLSKAQGGSIILLHETNSKTVAALPTIIEGLQQKGLVVTTVTDMLSQ